MEDLYVLHKLKCDCGTALEVHAEHVVGAFSSLILPWNARSATRSMRFPLDHCGFSKRIPTGLLRPFPSLIELCGTLLLPVSAGGLNGRAAEIRNPSCSNHPGSTETPQNRHELRVNRMRQTATSRCNVSRSRKLSLAIR